MSNKDSVEVRPENRDKPSITENKPPEKRPLSRVKAYLIELKTVLVLVREVLEEFKGVLVIVVLLALLIWEAFKLFH